MLGQVQRFDAIGQADIQQAAEFVEDQCRPGEIAVIVLIEEKMDSACLAANRRAAREHSEYVTEPYGGIVKLTSLPRAIHAELARCDGPRRLSAVRRRSCAASGAAETRPSSADTKEAARSRNRCDTETAAASSSRPSIAGHFGIRGFRQTACRSRASEVDEQPHDPAFAKAFEQQLRLDHPAHAAAAWQSRRNALKFHDRSNAGRRPAGCRCAARHWPRPCGRSGGPWPIGAGSMPSSLNRPRSAAGSPRSVTVTFLPSTRSIQAGQAARFEERLVQRAFGVRLRAFAYPSRPKYRCKSLPLPSVPPARFTSSASPTARSLDRRSARRPFSGGLKIWVALLMSSST